MVEPNNRDADRERNALPDGVLDIYAYINRVLNLDEDGHAVGYPATHLDSHGHIVAYAYPRANFDASSHTDAKPDADPGIDADSGA